jgi:hypothetical protein
MDTDIHAYTGDFEKMNGLKFYWIIYNKVSSQIQTITLQDNDNLENED